MKPPSTTPKLRFAGFTEPWKEDRLSKFFSSSRAKGRDGIPTLSVTLDRGLVDRSELDRKMETNLGPDEHLLVRKDDIAYNMMRMWQGAFGRADVEGMVSPAYVVLRPSSASHPAFFEYAFRRNRAIYLFWAYSYGITNDRLRLYADDFLRIPFRAPKVPEQQKIAAFLTAVDGRIEQLSRKKALLEEYKKGVMQQLFTQTLRFQDDHGHDFPDWEEKTLGEVLTIGSGKDYKHLKQGDVPVYGSGGVMTYVDTALYEGESVCIGRKGTIDKPRFVEGAFWTVDTLFYTHSFKGVLPRFVYALFQRINWQTYNEASGVPSLSKSTIESIPVSIPHLDEQTKIAGFLSALEGKIAAVGEQMRQTQAWKKGLLQQLFV